MCKLIKRKSREETSINTKGDTVVFNNKNIDKESNLAIVRLLVKDKSTGKKLIGKDVCIEQEETKSVFCGKVDKNGAVFQVPYGCKYIVHFKDAPNYQLIAVPNRKKLTMTFHILFSKSKFNETIKNDTIFQTVASDQEPTNKRVLIRINVIDFNNKPLPDEKIILENTSDTSLIYCTLTDSTGIARLIVPKGFAYYLSFEYDYRLDKLNYKHVETFRTTEIEFKYIGSTGGIYFTKGDSILPVLQAMFKTMTAGNGGDGPENDIEALLEAQVKKIRKVTEVILIADNYSDIKDLKLLAGLKIPVRIILCGVNAWINEEYLELAYKTNGSVHTIERDIYDLTKLNEGETLNYQGKKYKFAGGKFMLVD